MNWHNIFAGVVAGASIVAALGVVIGAWQIRLTKLQAQTDFEDDLSREYRSIIQYLPAHAFFEQAPDRVGSEEINAFFRYFDLSNEQLLLAEQGRVRETTAADWRAGMILNLRLPAFNRAWEEIVPNLDQAYWTLLRSLADA